MLEESYVIYSIQIYILQLERSQGKLSDVFLPKHADVLNATQQAISKGFNF